MKKKKDAAIPLQKEELEKQLKSKSSALARLKAELKIEASLEKVRSRSLAMHKSNDLLGVINTVFDQLTNLKIQADTASIIISKGNAKEIEQWIQNTERTYSSCIIVHYYATSIICRDLFEGRKSRKDILSKKYSMEEKNEFFEYLFTHSALKDISDHRKQFVRAAKSYTISIVNEKNTGIVLARYSDKFCSEQENNVLKRFAKVFEQAYIRFLDLQKAEAQAREAQIEAALEKVRSRTMSMFKSDELREVVFEFFKQMNPLGFAKWGCIIALANEEKGGFNEWLSPPTDRVLPECYHVPKLDHPAFEKMWSAYIDQVPYLTIEMKGAEKHNWDLLFFEKTDFKKMPQSVTGSIFAVPKVAFSLVPMRHGLVTAVDIDPIPEDMLKILGRFAKVFEQTYTRFLDLQKAEAQSREAQIELGLERVRARAMAMQHSDELKELIGTVYNELTKLDLALDCCLIWVMNNHDLSSRLWMANAESQPVNFYIPHHDNPPYLAFVKAWKDRNKRWQYDLHGQVKKEWDGFVFNQTEMKHLPDPVKKNMQATDRVMLAASFHNFGCLQTAGPEPLKEEQFDILNRFAKVFDLTYTRFNDLKQAEAQAREAQIELGLERVRARAMAMQKSDELSELVDTVFKELTKLDFALTWSIINIIDESSMSNTVWAANPDINNAPESYHMLFEDYPFHDAMMKGWKERKTKYVYTLEGLEKKIYDDYLFSETEFRRTPEAAQAASRAMEKYVVSFSFSNFGGLQTVGDVPLSDANLDILSRFGKVFDLTYTRFNDLKQAEAQARESQIQLALERVRARTMAMQKSDELKDAAALLFQQAKALGVPAYSCGYNIWEKNETTFTSWMSTQDGSDFNAVLNIPLTEDANFIRYVESKQKGEPFFVLELRGERMQEHYEYLKTIPAFKAYFDYAISVGYDLPETQIHHLANFSLGNLLFITLEPCPEFHDVFKRFAAVFEQTYTRFLDLQKAEEQAREAQIQLAMERVRARTMAMQRSDELSDVAFILFQQFRQLGETPIQITIGVFNEEAGIAEFRITGANGSGDKIEQAFNLSIQEPILIKKMYGAWKEQKRSNIIELTGQELVDWVRYRNTVSGFPDDSFKINPDEHRSVCAGFFSKGMITFSKESGMPAETIQILERFAGVFDLTYTRFLDLQKAEAQAREAQIEAALERVRSRSMGMQKSEELKEVIQVVYEQFVHLNIKIEHTGFVIDYKTRDDYNIWIADPLGVPSQVTVPYFDSVYYNRFNEAKEKGEDFFATNLSFEEKNKFYQKLFEYIPGLPEEAKEFYFSCPGLAASTVLLENVGLYIENFSGIPYTDEENTTLMRFGKVFQQTYTRFLDLQKAEAQVREAKIETALERTRTQSMIMQHSKELDDTLRVFHEQVLLLGINSAFSFLWLPDEEKDRHIFWAAWAENISITQLVNHNSTIFKSKAINYPLDRNEPATAQCLVDWKGTEPIVSYHVPPPGVENYFAAWQELIDGVEQLKPEYFSGGLYYVEAFMKYGCFGVMVTTDLTEDEKKILGRFAIEFERAYTRFLDLQKAEAQAREAQIEAALERVRSRTLAMQKSDELAETAAVLFRQLINLGIAPNRLYIGIVKDDIGHIEFWVTNEDGSKVSTQFSGDSSRNASMHKMFEGWKEQKKSLTIDMHGKELENYFHYLSDELHVPFKGGLAQKRRIQTISYFSKGFTGMASPDEQPQETTFLLERFAAVFNLTYTRFNDLKIAESHALQAEEDLIKLQTEKKRAEDALTELRATQNQLIQSEKMASLGELTAGIAHEIQNPLNFVNNFSEVSVELLKEMVEEVDKGNTDEAKDIAADLVHNLEKINHHGKRADAIVKGMLQHSRSSTGKKEPTNINALADEYLRLAYHGLRAKDKSFNATIKTDFDVTIGNINIIPQDIGRVILNLITNAFYVVDEKKKQIGDGYEPTVSVSTKKESDKAFVSVKDNGKGIPQKVLDKIFQPFFTTKPTGQGTGLGLSLSYDIIKAHGGEIKVETKDGEGTDFIIQLPMA